MNRLTEAKVATIDRDLRKVHRHVHELLETEPGKRKRVTAAFLKQTAIDLRAIAANFDSLAASPFFGVEAAPHRALNEPETTT